MVEYDYVTKKRDEVKPLPEQHMGAIKYVMRWATKARFTQKWVNTAAP